MAERETLSRSHALPCPSYTPTKLRLTSAPGLPPPHLRWPFQPLPLPNPYCSLPRTAVSPWSKPGRPPETSPRLAPGASQAEEPAAAPSFSSATLIVASRRRWLSAVRCRGGGGGRLPFLSCLEQELRCSVQKSWPAKAVLLTPQKLLNRPNRSANRLCFVPD